VQATEQPAEMAEAARRPDRVPPLLPGNRVGPPGDQHAAAADDGHWLVRRAPLGRELAGRQVTEDRGVARHRLGLRAGNHRATQSGPSARRTRHTPRSSSVIASTVIP
jgi:hypothetical protein